MTKIKLKTSNWQEKRINHPGRKKDNAMHPTLAQLDRGGYRSIWPAQVALILSHRATEVEHAAVRTVAEFRAWGGHFSELDYTGQRLMTEAKETIKNSKWGQYLDYAASIIAKADRDEHLDDDEMSVYGALRR